MRTAFRAATIELKNSHSHIWAPVQAISLNSGCIFI